MGSGISLVVAGLVMEFILDETCRRLGPGFLLRCVDGVLVVDDMESLDRFRREFCMIGGNMQVAKTDEMDSGIGFLNVTIVGDVSMGCLSCCCRGDMASDGLLHFGSFHPKSIIHNT